MKQVVRRVIDRKGNVVLLDLPAPHLGPDQVFVQNEFSLISSGTELSTLSKTPAELVKQTISDPWMRHVVAQTVFVAGPTQTARRIWQEMLMPREIGYSGAGTVLAVGRNVEGFRVGGKAAYAATGHAEIVAPTINHIVPVPDRLDLKHAAFVTVGGIAIQSLRRASVQFGETVAIYGLGLVGQICAMIAKAAGCVVIGIDIDPGRTEIARECGADLVLNPSGTDLHRRIMDTTRKHGVDSTIICAHSKSDAIINSSMEITRKQGRVVIVGYVKLDINPKNFLHREIDLRYSRAYGPGSYHHSYEKGRVDYPYEYVRWTEKRNLEEFVRLIDSGSINLAPLIGATYPLDRAQEAFDAISGGTLPGVAALLQYSSEDLDGRQAIILAERPKKAGKTGISLVGCGNHTLGSTIPLLTSFSDVEIRAIATATGKNAELVAKKVSATMTTTEISDALNDPGTDGLIISSNHSEHAQHIEMAIDAGKAIYVDKPMVTLAKDYVEIARKLEANPILFALGLNRRYSPIVTKARELLQGPLNSIKYQVCQPFVPPEHWTLDPIDGGGRLLCEGEHFIDLCNFLIGQRPQSIFACVLGKEPEDVRSLSGFSITLHYAGAEANIVFSESGVQGYPREKLTLLGSGQVLVIDEFAKLTVFGNKKRVVGKGLKKQMGHEQSLHQFVKALRGEPNSLLTWEEAEAATLSLFAAQESIRTGQSISIRQFRQELFDTVPSHPPNHQADS